PGHQRQVGKAVAEIFPHQLQFGAGHTCPTATTGKKLLEGSRQPKARTVRDMDRCKWGKELYLTDCVSRVEFGKGTLEQCPQKCHCPAGHALGQGFRRDLHRRGHVRRFGRQLPQRGLARTPRPHRHQGQKHFARELGAAPDKPRVPRAGFDLGGGKEFCYLLHYAEPRFGHRSLLSLVVDDNPMPPYHERETATPPMNSRCYAVSLMPMPGCPAWSAGDGRGSSSGPPMTTPPTSPGATATSTGRFRMHNSRVSSTVSPSGSPASTCGPSARSRPL